MKRALALFLSLAACDGVIRLAGSDAGAIASQTDGASGVSGDGGGDGGVGVVAPPSGGCSVEADCRFGHCNVTARLCVECLSDPDCAAGPRTRCDTAIHRCVACGLDSDCANNDKCESTTHRCVPACGSCPSDSPICDSARGICVVCTGPAGCSSDRTCDVAGGRCVECLTDAQCTAPDRAHCDPISGLCVACITTPDCPAATPICDPAKLECQGP